MDPNQLISVIRKIATSINSSKNPRKDLVARDLRRVLVALEEDVEVEDVEVEDVEVEEPGSSLQECIRVCEECADMCEEHSDVSQIVKACAEVCRACAAECTRLSEVETETEI